MKSTERLRIVALGVLLIPALVLSLWALARTNDWEGCALNLGTEMAGAAATYILIELIIGRREKLEAESEKLQVKKKDLIARLGSSVHDVSVAAAEELRRYGWHRDGSLQGVNLFEANLQGVDLSEADIRGAILTQANLEDANLSNANLQRAGLLLTNLQSAELDGADLRQALLNGCDLQKASLRRADFRGANLLKAELVGADLDEAFFDVETVLPEGNRWTTDTNIADLASTWLIY